LLRPRTGKKKKEKRRPAVRTGTPTRASGCRSPGRLIACWLARSSAKTENCRSARHAMAVVSSLRAVSISLTTKGRETIARRVRSRSFTERRKRCGDLREEAGGRPDGDVCAWGVTRFSCRHGVGSHRVRCVSCGSAQGCSEGRRATTNQRIPVAHSGMRTFLAAKGSGSVRAYIG